MLHALHGNAGLPGDLAPLLAAVGHPAEAWHLWQFLDEHRGADSLWGFADAFQQEVDRRQDSGPRLLFGYSLGARLALHVLTRAPEKWDAAIVISPHPGLTGSDDREARMRVDQSWAVRFLRDDWNEVMHAWNSQPTLAGESVPQYDQLLVETWRREVAAGCNGWSLARQEDLRPKLASVKCPVLWITGARDEKFTTLASACTRLPRGTHQTIPDAGHRPHLDQPDAVAEEIRAFLQSAGLAAAE
jgi:2-succinyl-6-hydroxy-2,4-cyclohexadiene-1-carboxylate synthase